MIQRVPYEYSEESRDCFIQAFKELYPQTGMKGLSASTLSARAGYSRSTFYRCFDSVYDVLNAVEKEAMPYEEMAYLIEHANTVNMRQITDGFLGAFRRKEELIRILGTHNDNSFYARMADCIKPVFRTQAERVYIMEPEEYDIMAEYLTNAKVSLLRLWARSENPMNLGHMTQITDSVLEGGFWDRVEEAARVTAAGGRYERTPLSFFKEQHPWIADRPLY